MHKARMEVGCASNPMLTLLLCQHRRYRMLLSEDLLHVALVLPLAVGASCPRTQQYQTCYHMACSVTLWLLLYSREDTTACAWFLATHPVWPALQGAGVSGLHLPPEPFQAGRVSLAPKRAWLTMPCSLLVTARSARCSSVTSLTLGRRRACDGWKGRLAP
jgi:hypothetical protein